MLLTVAEVAQQLQLQLSVSCVYRIIASGELVVVRLGNERGRIRITPDDLADYVAQCRTRNAKLQTPQPVQHLQLKHLRFPS